MNATATATNRETPTKDQLRARWSALTEGDLEGIAGQKAPLAEKLQERYGFGKEQAEREADEFLRNRNESNRAPSTPSTPQSPATPQPAKPETPTSPGPRAETTVPPPTEPQKWEQPIIPSPRVETPVPPLKEPDIQQPAPVPATPTTARGYQHSATLWISPRLLQWIVPITVVMLVILLFLPWVGAYPGGYGVYTQTAFQAIYGGVTVDPVGDRALQSQKPYDSIPGSGLMLLYVILVIFAFVLIVGPLWFNARRIQFAPQFVRFLARGRLEALALVVFVAMIMLIFQLSMGLGLETAIEAKADKNLTSELAAAKTPEERQTAEIHRAAAIGPYHVGQTFWVGLTIASQIILLTGIGMQFWLKRRGDRPLPRIEAHA